VFVCADHRPDCKQVILLLVVSRCGDPLGSEVVRRHPHYATTRGRDPLRTWKSFTVEPAAGLGTVSGNREMCGFCGMAGGR